MIPLLVCCIKLIRLLLIILLKNYSSSRISSLLARTSMDQYHVKLLCTAKAPTIAEARIHRKASLDRAYSFQVRGPLTWLRTFWNCNLVSSIVPELSMVISAFSLFKSSAIWAFILFLASSADMPSLAVRRATWVSGSTHTTMIGDVLRSILASNNNGMSRIITFEPFIHSFSTSQKMPKDIYGANRLKVRRK